MSDKAIRIGTRDSLLAQWQSNEVAKLLAGNSLNSNLVLIKSEGDINLTTPLYEMGVQGIFTKTLDAALLDNRIDLAVHSYKDVPTKLAAGLAIAAVLKRANPFDVMVCRNEETYRKFIQKPEDISKAYVIATSSSRRKAQWLNRFPDSHIDNLRGNVNSRLKKLYASYWDGAIFAAAGLERLDVQNLLTVELSWMLPAPAQGAIVVVSREGDERMINACANFDDHHSSICTCVEKDFLRSLLGGCSTPIGAYANIVESKIYFKGNILSPDGKLKKEIELTKNIEDHKSMGSEAASKILNEGGREIISTFKNVETDD